MGYRKYALASKAEPWPLAHSIRPARIQAVFLLCRAAKLPAPPAPRRAISPVRAEGKSTGEGFPARARRTPAIAASRRSPEDGRASTAPTPARPDSVLSGMALWHSEER